MMLSNIPEDLSAELLINYLQPVNPTVSILGPHKRNAYRDIVSVEYDKEERPLIGISRKSLYDILPEALFHPLNRFDNLPANDYEERFAEECRLQQEEEENVRTFFKPFDTFLFRLQSLFVSEKERYSDDSVISSIICDSISNSTLENRFIKQAMQFIPLCKVIRGNRTLVTLMLRQILMNEGLELEYVSEPNNTVDKNPRYVCDLDGISDIDETFVGNEFTENVAIYHIKFWDEDECDDKFLNFVQDLDVFQDFINDYFMGIETGIRFSLETDSLPVRLSDEMMYNYLNYNTNI